jgi:pyridoxal phosphate enzyme (YggS family)
MPAVSAIAQRYESVLRHLADAADMAGRDPRDVTVVAVTKTVGVVEVRQAIAAGMTDFGENRAQEFTGKQALFPDMHWHFIGTLQTNKVKDVVGRATLIHSVDSMHLLRAVDHHASEIGVVQDVLLQVNVSGELSKHGMTEEEAEEAVRAACGLPGVQVRGVMTMAPYTRPQATRPVFRETADLLGRLQSMHCDGVDLTELSMGMTNDFRVAIEEGATIVRIGRAIFGK